MSTFQFEIVTPTRTLDKGQVNYVRCPEWMARLV